MTNRNDAFKGSCPLASFSTKNTPVPFTEDVYFITGDKVLQKDGYLKILGRDSEIINVGGEKVFPQEVENVIQELDEVIEVTIYKEKNAIMGNIVCANIRLVDGLKQKATKIKIIWTI